MDSDEDLGRFEMETLTFERASGWGRGEGSQGGSRSLSVAGKKTFWTKAHFRSRCQPRREGGRESERERERERERRGRSRE